MSYLNKLVCIFFVFVALSGCEQHQRPLRIALLEWPPYELAFWAEKNRWFNEDQVRLLEYKTPAEVTRAFSTGAVDVIAVTSDFALTVMEQYPDTRIVTVIDSSNGGDTILSKVAAAKGDDFSGYTIALEAGPLGSYMLARFTEKFDISSSDLTVKYVDIPAQESAWQNEDIDLLITYEPIRTKLISTGAHEIFTSKDIPNEIIDVFLIREKGLAEHESNLTAFLNGWFKAVADLKSENPELYQFIGARLGITAEATQQAFQQVEVPGFNENLQYLSGKNRDFLNGLEQHEKVLLDKQLMKKPIDKQKLITNRALLMVERAE